MDVLLPHAHLGLLPRYPGKTPFLGVVRDAFPDITGTTDIDANMSPLNSQMNAVLGCVKFIITR
jgi:hypothetical protein